MKKVCCQLSLCLVCHVRTGRPAIENGDRENFKQFLTFQFKIFFFLKRPSTGILTLFQKGVQPVKVSQVSAKRWKEKIGGKAREEGPCAQSIWKQSQPQCGPEWYLHNSIFLWIREKVCLDAPSDWWTVEPEAEVKTAQSRVWLKFSGNVECAWQLVKNASGRRAAEVFMETTEEHKVLRSINRAKKNHESHTVTEKGPSRGKIGLSEPRGVEGMYQNSRCASREKTWVQSTKKLNENWDAISLVFLSAVLRDNFSSFRSTLHNLSHIMFFNVWN